jgi:hypothetical protein
MYLYHIELKALFVVPFIRLTCTEDKRVMLWDGNKSCYGISQHNLLDSKLTVDKSWYLNWSDFKF